MKLQSPPRVYSAQHEMARNGLIERMDRQNHKRNEDVEIGNGRLILTDESTGTRYQVYITGGTLSLRSL